MFYLLLEHLKQIKGVKLYREQMAGMHRQETPLT